MFSKKDQLRKSGKMKEQGAEDRKYLGDLKEMTLHCIVCGCNNTELHHVYSVVHGIKRSDHRVVPLCAEHHRGAKCSPHGGKEAFYSIFSLNDLIMLADIIRARYLQNV